MAPTGDGRWESTNLGELREWQSSFARNYDHYLTMSNPIVQAIHQAQGRFIATSLDLGGSFLTHMGNALTVAGAVTAWTGGGAALAGLGQGLSKIGSAMSLGSTLMTGSKDAKIFGLANAGVSYVLGRIPIWGNLNIENQAIYNGLMSFFTTTLDAAGKTIY